MTETTADYLLIGLSQGDEKVILKIYKKVFPNVRTFVLSNKGSAEDAEKIFQEALYQLALRLKVTDITITSSFEAYMFTVCKNLWRRELNRKKKWVRNEGVIVLKGEQQQDPNHNDAILAQERNDLFEAKFKLLTENCRQLLKEYFNKTPYSDIVKKFKYSSENVAFQRVFKCKKRLTDLVKKDGKYKELTQSLD